MFCHSNFYNVCFLGSASDLAPTSTVLLNKEKQELNFLKEKLEWQKKKIEELEEERDFLRGQLSALTGTWLELASFRHQQKSWFYKHYMISTGQ